MPTLDIKKDLPCKNCGSPREEAEHLDIHLGEQEVWRGCIVCARVALSLPQWLPRLVAAAIEEVEKVRRPGMCPAEVSQPARRGVEQDLRQLRDEARVATRGEE